MNLNKPVKNLESDRLLLRFVDLNDAKDFYVFCSKDNVTKYLTFDPYKHIFQARRAITNMIRSYLAEKCINYSIVLKNTNKVIGSISITQVDNHSAEIGYLLDDDYWNLGYMSEALKLIVEASFNYYDIDILIGKYIKENISSEKVLLKNGFKLISVLRNGFIKNNKSYDLFVTKLESHVI